MIHAFERTKCEELRKHVLAQADEIARLRDWVADMEAKAVVSEASRVRLVTEIQDLLMRLAAEHDRLLSVEVLVRTAEPSRWQPPADRGRWEERAKALGLERRLSCGGNHDK